MSKTCLSEIFNADFDSVIVCWAQSLIHFCRKIHFEKQNTCTLHNNLKNF